jgi:hypothetical protein
MVPLHQTAQKGLNAVPTQSPDRGRYTTLIDERKRRRDPNRTEHL